MSFMSWLPSAFKDLLKHVPTILFEVVSWNALMKDAALLSKRLITGEGVDNARQEVTSRLPTGVQFVDFAPTPPATAESRQMLGEKILAVYFKQLTCPGPMFLDLRLSGFGVANNQVAWNPTSLWGEFSAGFVDGLGDLYGGFYGQDKTRFEKGLDKTGLIQASWSEEDRDRMATLFRAHFGQSLDAPMSFKLETFQKSFQAVFTFLMEKKVHLTTDFLLLGVMLVTLYLSLEELGGEYSVASIYKASAT
jgi:hypothetical protein